MMHQLPVGWKRAAFDEVIRDVSAGNAKVSNGRFRAAGTYPVVDQGQHFIAGYSNEAENLCRAELPVIVFGDHTRAVKFVDFPFCMGADGTKILRPANDDHPRYLYHFLRQVRLPDAGYSRHFKYLRESEIILPPLPEQRRIAEVLDRAETLRTERRAALAQLEALTHTIFLDMFGDPSANPKGWHQRMIGELATKFSDGPFGSNLKSSHYTEHGIRVIRLQNIGVGEFIDNDKAFIAESHFATLKKHECREGDILIGTLGDPNLRACIQPESLPVALNKADCVQMRVDEQVATAAYVCALLNEPATERMAQGLMHGQTRVRISMGRLRGLKVPVPPLPLQREFARRVVAVERMKTAQRASLAELDALFASLRHRAFRGEL
jgi:type I restriction enzyme S subunit